MIQDESLLKPTEGQTQSFLNLTKSQTETIAAIQRNAGKLAFDTMIRLMYIAPKDAFEKTRGMGIIGSMRQFGSGTLNGIKPVFFTFPHPSPDHKGLRQKKRMNNFIE